MAIPVGLSGSSTQHFPGPRVSNPLNLRFVLHILLSLLLYTNLCAQVKLDLDGQLSILGSYAPQNDHALFLGGRYLPELDLVLPLDSLKKLDFEASANLSGSLHLATQAQQSPFTDLQSQAALNPYRLWARYSSRQFEFRLGLQKIDFGSATLLRPLQWFNQIDPRDPLQLTNGVNAALGRYYFLNNANLWAWVLYGNDKARGFDALPTQKRQPEFGGRFQTPVPKGELAVSFHHRRANSKDFPLVPAFDQIRENRFALDGKWDVGPGIWFEAVYVHKARQLGLLTHQAFLNAGTDYTFPLGNGLNVILEHLVTALDQSPFQLEQKGQVTALTSMYPLGLFDNLSAVWLFNWQSQDLTFFLNYQHRFKRMTGYLMAFYNPETQVGFQQNELVNQFSGPGIRAMVVFNH